jgi:hypothetical protein
VKREIEPEEREVVKGKREGSYDMMTGSNMDPKETPIRAPARMAGIRYGA